MTAASGASKARSQPRRKAIASSRPYARKTSAISVSGASRAACGGSDGGGVRVVVAVVDDHHQVVDTSSDAGVLLASSVAISETVGGRVYVECGAHYR